MALANAKTKATCISARIMLDMVWLAMNSDALVGVVLIRLKIPFSRSMVNDCATIMVRKMEAKAKSPGTM